MDMHDPPKPKSQRMGRGLLVLLALVLGLMAAVSLANAGRNAGWTSTELQLQNVDFLPRPVTTTYYSALGAESLVITDSLSGGRTEFFSPTLQSQFTGTVRVDSPGTVLGVVTHLDDNPPGAAQWPLIDDADLNDMAYVPHFTAQQGRPASRLTIHNLEPALMTTAWITFYDSSGSVVHTTGARSIPPLGAQFLDAAELGISPSMPFPLSALVRADGRIYASVDRTVGGAFSSAHTPAQGGFTIAAPMFFAQYNSLSSTLAVQNIGPVTATGALAFYEDDGSLRVIRMFTIAPSAALNWTAPLSGAFGHVVATANQPLAGLVLGEGTFPPGVWDYTAVVVEPEKPDTLDRRIAYAPVVYTRYLSWGSHAFIANLSANEASVLVEYSSALTGIVTRTKLTVPPHALVVPNTLDFAPEFEHASLKVSSDQLIAATIWSFNPQSLVSDAYMAYEAQYASPTPENRAYLPIIMK